MQQRFIVWCGLWEFGVVGLARYLVWWEVNEFLVMILYLFLGYLHIKEYEGFEGVFLSLKLDTIGYDLCFLSFFS